MGRKKIPTKLKIVKGTHRHWRENPNEPDYPTAIPQPPGHLSERAMAEWNEMSQILYDQGLLSIIDKACLAGYCQLYGRWAEAEASLKRTKQLIKTTSGNIIQNPLIGIANTAYKLMKDSLIEFGMTPASRSKVSAKKSKKKEDPWDEFGAQKKVKK